MPIAQFRRNAERWPPTFVIELWNMFHRTDAELSQTNSSTKKWHRSFNATLPFCHAVFWKFLEVLKREESLIRVQILQFVSEDAPPPNRFWYMGCIVRILPVADNFPNRQPLNYLRSISHNLSYWSYFRCIVWYITASYCGNHFVFWTWSLFLLKFYFKKPVRNSYLFALLVARYTFFLITRFFI